MQLEIFYLVAAVGIIFKIYAQRGYDLKPMLYEDGKFQLNVVFTVIAGFFATIPLINTIVAGAGVEPISQIYAAFAVLVTAYGAPELLDGIGTVVTPTPAAVA